MIAVGALLATVSGVAFCAVGAHYCIVDSIILTRVRKAVLAGSWAGAGLAGVLLLAGGITIIARCTLLTVIADRIVSAVLANAAVRVAAVRVSVTVAQLTHAQVRAGNSRETRCAVLAR